MGTLLLTFKIKQQSYTQTFHVFQSLFCKIILGKKFLQQSSACIDLGARKVTFGQSLQNVALLSQPQTGLARIKSALVLPPESEVIFPVTISHCKNTLVLLEPLTHQQSFLVAKMLINVDNTGAAYICPLAESMGQTYMIVTSHCCSESLLSIGGTQQCHGSI